MTKVGIVGSHKDWTPGTTASASRVSLLFLSTFGTGNTFVSGGAKGADTFGEEAATALGYELDIKLPDFDRYGSPAAYFVRNKLIAEAGDVFLALFSDDRTTNGTKDTIKHALKLGKVVYEWHANEHNHLRIVPNDRCQMSYGYHVNPHKGCILR
jgi:hypothetical protein